MAQEYELSMEAGSTGRGASLLGVAVMAVVGVVYVAISAPALDPAEEQRLALEPLAMPAAESTMITPLDAGVDWSKVPAAPDEGGAAVAAYGP